MPDEAAAVERVFRAEYGRLIASLVRRFGDIDLAEDAAGEALVAALEKWPTSGVPPNPGGWLTVTAGNRAIDRIRREKQRDAKQQERGPGGDRGAQFMHVVDQAVGGEQQAHGQHGEEDHQGEGTGFFIQLRFDVGAGRRGSQ